MDGFLKSYKFDKRWHISTLETNLMGIMKWIASSLIGKITPSVLTHRLHSLANIPKQYTLYFLLQPYIQLILITLGWSVISRHLSVGIGRHLSVPYPVNKDKLTGKAQ